MSNEHTGEKIKQIRIMHRLSVEELALKAGLSVAEITSLENGNIVSTLTPLSKITRALGVRLSTLIDDEEVVGPVVVKKGTSNKVLHFSGSSQEEDQKGASFFSLASGKLDRHMEPFIIEVKPAKTKEIKFSSHEGEEFIFVLEGEIEVEYGKKHFSLKPGDSIYYSSVIPHALYSLNKSAAKIIAVIYAS